MLAVQRECALQERRWIQAHALVAVFLSVCGTLRADGPLVVTLLDVRQGEGIPRLRP